MGLRSRLKDGLRRVVIGPPLEGPAGPASVRGEDGWIALCPRIGLQEGQPRSFAIEGGPVAAFVVGRDVFVVDDEDGAAQGRQEGAVLESHGRRYDLRDGTCLTDPDRRLPTRPVRIRDGWVLVGAARSDRGG
jgi:nitrite reductase/ring-hydroxylating ferredoxin subunit